jgi:hypothetical protein
MYCKNCGFNYEGNYCPKCGTKNDYIIPVNNTSAGNARKPKQTSKKFIAFLIVLAALITGGSVLAPIGYAVFAGYMLDNIAGSSLTNSLETHSISDSASINKFKYSIDKVSYTDKYDDEKADSGYEYMKIKVKITNTSSSRAFCLADAELYIDDVIYEEYDSDSLSDELDAGKSKIAELVYEVPEKRDKIELFLRADSLFDSKAIKFNIYDED